MQNLQTIQLISGDCSICISASPKNCFSFNGACFYRQCGNYNWYEARSRCKDLNMHLAVSVMNVQKDLESWLNDETCSRLWIGYSKEDWYFESTSNGKMLLYCILKCYNHTIGSKTKNRKVFQ